MNPNEKLIMRNFGLQIKEFRNSCIPKLSQDKFANMIIEKTNIKNMRQEKISILERGKDASLLEKEIQAIGEVCRMSDDVLESYINLMRIKHPYKVSEVSIDVKENENLWVKYNHSEFRFYEGTYYCYFHSTNAKESKIVEGRMNLSKSQSRKNCIAKFEIIENGTPIKKYNGQFFINVVYSMSYCVLISEEKQEVSFLISDHYNASAKKENLFNIALVLTTSAGEKKQPTMHRMIISRKELPYETLQTICPQLKIGNEWIYISKSEMEAVEDIYMSRVKQTYDTKEINDYNNILNMIYEIQNNDSNNELYFKISEKSLYENMITDMEKTRQFISVLREHANSDYSNRVTDVAKEICKKAIEEL